MKEQLGREEQTSRIFECDAIKLDSILSEVEVDESEAEESATKLERHAKMQTVDSSRTSRRRSSNNGNLLQARNWQSFKSGQALRLVNVMKRLTLESPMRENTWTTIFRKRDDVE